MDIFEQMAKKELAHLCYRGGRWSHPDVNVTERFEELCALLEEMDHEELHFFSDPIIGGRFIVAIHSTKLGESLGGFRLFEYPDGFAAARDALRLSRGMTFKSAAVGLPLGGGKAVGWVSRELKSAELLRSFARFLTLLDGRYITAEDVGTSPEDMDIIDREIERVSPDSPPLIVCRSKGRGGWGNPSPFTAAGIYEAMRIGCRERFGSEALAGRTVAIQGLGNVGSALARMLLADGANLVVSETDPDKVGVLLNDRQCVDRCGLMSRSDIYGAECDVFSPCAMGGVLNDYTVPKLKCSLVIGSANNQLEDEARHGRMLADRGILYAPDFLVNAGGVINAALEYDSRLKGRELNRELVVEKLADIGMNLKEVFQRVREQGTLPHDAAMMIAKERLRAADAGAL